MIHVDLVGQTDLVVPRGSLQTILQTVKFTVLGLEVQTGVRGVVGGSAGALAASEPAGKAAAHQRAQGGQAGRDDTNARLDGGPNEGLGHVPGQIGTLAHKGQEVYAHDTRDTDAGVVS